MKRDDSRLYDKKISFITKTLRNIFATEIQNDDVIHGNAIVTISNIFPLDGCKLLKVYVSVLTLNKNNDHSFYIDYLNQHKSAIRLTFGNKLADKIRFVPDIQFYYDDTYDNIKKVKDIMSKIGTC